MKNKHLAIVTGVSKGIGLAITKCLLEKGIAVAGWGRSKPDMDDNRFHFHRVDVADEKAVLDAFEKTIHGFEVDKLILINNAGVGVFKWVDDLTSEDWHAMMNVNVNALFYTVKAVLPFMKSSGKGHIINISSIAGLSGIPEATGYCATKYAVRGFSDALQKELKRFNIKVTCVYPGSVNTDFFVNYQRVKANDTMMHPNDVADSIAHLIETPDNFCPSELVIRPLNVDYKG
jgi:NADP-dependent 3-hydroxy acid dehydrogenase YdfG